MSFVRLKAQELGLLNKYVFPILAWVREEEQEAGDMFLGSALDVDDDEVHTKLKELLSEHRSNPDMPVDQARELFRQSPTSVWLRAAHTLLMSSSPRVIDESTSRALMKAWEQAGGDDATSKELVKTMDPVIRAIPEVNRHALGELCDMLRETCLDPECTAFALAPTIFLPADADESDRNLVKQVFASMVLHSETLFAADADRPRGGSSVTARQTDNSLHLTEDEKQKRAALREFFEWRDPHNVELVDDLFTNFDFIDIAKGIQRKYGILPPGFIPFLDALVTEGAKGLHWYDKAKQVPKTKRFSLLPRINRRPISKPPEYVPTQVDRIIDEIVATEVTYHDTMKDLYDLYISEIMAIVDGKRGKEAISQLGLKASEVEKVFGARLRNVLDVSNDLLAKLDLVSLVPTPPKSDIGRAGLVAQILSDHAPNLRVYAPYVSTHMNMVKTLKEALARVEKADKLKASSSARKLLGKEKREVRHSFVHLWFELSSKSPHLRGHTLESILIMPVQRVPRYKLLLETLRKEVPKINAQDPAIPIIEEAYENVMQAARQINTAVKQHMKLESFFGKDSMINPNNSIVRVDAKGNFEAIVNSYIG